MRILGVDPGLTATGYGVIDTAPGMRLVEAGVIRTNPEESLGERLNDLYEGLSGLMKDTRPAVLVLEKVFSHYKHPATAILMGHARGAICLSAARQAVRLFDIPSTRVKKAVISHGHASKAQIQRAVQGFLGLKKIPSPSHVADALAIAMAYALTEEKAGRMLAGAGERRADFRNRLKEFTGK